LFYKKKTFALVIRLFTFKAAVILFLKLYIYKSFQHVKLTYNS
jgi:hypothetical protein